MYDVLCIGDTCCDMIFADLGKIPDPGKEEYCRELYIKAGGAANTAMGLSRLGKKVLLATALGRDILGDAVYEFMSHTGLDMSAVKRMDGMKTSVSAVLSVGYERSFASYSGAGMAFFTQEEIGYLISRTRHVHTYVGYCMMFPIISLCKQYGCSLSLDTSWCDQSVEDVRDILSGCDIFKPNETEAMQLTAKATCDEALKELARYCPLPVITLGGAGAAAYTGGKRYHAKCARPVDVRDTTGAGDIFLAGFIYGFLEGWDIQKTLGFACASGTLSVTYYGSVDDSYTLENVLALAD